MMASAPQNAARRRAVRRAAGEVDSSDKSLLLEEISAEAAWPRSKTVAGGGLGHVIVNGCGDDLYSFVSTFSIRSAAQSISSRPMVSGGATRITVAWVSLHSRPSS